MLPASVVRGRHPTGVPPLAVMRGNLVDWVTGPALVQVVVPLVFVTKPASCRSGRGSNSALGRRAGDAGVGAIEDAALHVGQAVEGVHGVELVQARRDGRGADHIRLLDAVGVLVVAILVAVDVDRRGGDVVLPALVDDAAEEVDAGEDAAGPAPQVEPDAGLGVGDADDGAEAEVDVGREVGGAAGGVSQVSMRFRMSFMPPAAVDAGDASSGSGRSGSWAGSGWTRSSRRRRCTGPWAWSCVTAPECSCCSVVGWPKSLYASSPG